MTNQLVDIIIVNWNCGDQLRACLKSIAACGDEGAFLVNRVIVVDNASSDGSADGLGSLPLPLTLVKNETNRGFAAACNQAASGSKADYLLFLNPDTRLFAGALARSVQAMNAVANASVGIVGVQLLDADGKVTRTCARFLTPGMVARRILGIEHLPWSPWPPNLMTDWDHKATAAVDHVIGAFFFVRRTLFERLGGMDEQFFVYLEDVDFSLRAKRHGFGTLYLADAHVFHKGGGASQQAKARSLYYALSSRILYGFKHFSPWKAWALLFATLAVEPITRGAYAAVHGSLGKIRNTVTAYWLLWRSLPVLVRTRSGASRS